MTWSDGLRRVTLPDGRRLIGASFRGVPFFVEDSERPFGRRVQVHEFPHRDDPYIDDLGRKARVFSVTGYVVGDDYLQQRDALLAALEDEEGPGELVHPYHGTRRAICSGGSVRETRREGRMAVLAMEFTEAPAQAVTPTEAPDLAEQVDASATASLAATQAEFEDGYDVDGAPAYSLDSIEEALVTATESLGEALAPVVETTQELAQLTAQIQLITARAASLVRQPGEVLTAFADTLGILVEAVASAPRAVFRAFLDTYRVDLGSVVYTTETENRIRERDNHAAMVAALRRILAIEAARLMPSITFDHHDDAVAARDEFAALLIEQEGLAGDEVYPALVQLRTDVSRAIPGDAVLARLVTLDRHVPIPSLLLTYQLYGSVEDESDVVARNRTRHPGFMTGSLKVLSRGG